MMSPLKPIFSYHIDARKAAYLNWRIERNDDVGNMLAMADGYLSSAVELAKVCLKNNSDKKADKLIFAILGNANHGIELYMKSLIWTLNKLLKSRFRIEGSHNIQQMYKTIQSKILQYKGKEWLEGFNEGNSNLSSYIDELFSMTQGDFKNDRMDFARYPITAKYQDHFYVNFNGNVVIDLENLIERFEQMKDALDERASYFFYQELQGDL